MSRVLFRIMDLQHLAQVMSQLRHQEVLNHPMSRVLCMTLLLPVTELMHIPNITCHNYVIMCMSQTTRPCNRHSHIRMHHSATGTRPTQCNPWVITASMESRWLWHRSAWWREKRDVWWLWWRKSHHNRTERSHRQSTPLRWWSSSAPVHNGEPQWISEDRHANRHQENVGSWAWSVLILLSRCLMKILPLSNTTQFIEMKIIFES